MAQAAGALLISCAERQSDPPESRGIRHGVEPEQNGFTGPHGVATIGDR